MQEQRYLIWKYCHEQSAAWQSEKARIQDEANRKRSEAMQGVPYAPKGEERKPEKVVRQSVGAHTPPATKAKAAASKTNPGAVARGDKIAKERPDLAEGVRLGTIKPAEAHRLMNKDEVKEKTKALPEGKHRVIYADPPWKYNDAETVKSGGCTCWDGRNRKSQTNSQRCGRMPRGPHSKASPIFYQKR